MSEDIRAQYLTAARVCILHSDPNTVVVAMSGEVETHHFILTRRELAVLAQRLTQDAALLNAEPTNSD